MSINFIKIKYFVVHYFVIYYKPAKNALVGELGGRCDES